MTASTRSIDLESAILEALAAEMRRDPRVVLWGEGVATHHRALVDAFGADRVRNTPLAEAIVSGTAVGAAAMGLRPVIDLLFAPFLTLAMDALVNSAGKLRTLSGGQFAFPLVVLAKTGAGWCVGAQHNHNLEAMFVHAPGLKLAMPSTPADAMGLTVSAIRDDNPVLLFTDLALAHAPGPVPADGSMPVVPLGQAAVRRRGRDVTLVSYAKTVGHCLQAAEQLAAEDIEAEVVDLRSLKPLDTATVLQSVRRTGRLVVVHEASGLCGIAAEIAAVVAEQAHGALKAPVRRVTGPDAPSSASWVLEQAGVPQPEAIAAAVRSITTTGARIAVPA